MTDKDWEWFETFFTQPSKCFGQPSSTHTGGSDEAGGGGGGGGGCRGEGKMEISIPAWDLQAVSKLLWAYAAFERAVPCAVEAKLGEVYICVYIYVYIGPYYSAHA